MPSRLSGPLCLERGTLPLLPEPGGPFATAPRPTGLATEPGQEPRVSDPVEAVVELAYPAAVPVAWDTFWRGIYDIADQALGSQARELAQKEWITFDEGKAFSDQRDALRDALRKPLTPLGQAFSEAVETQRTYVERLKAKATGEAAKQLAQKGQPVTRQWTIRAVLESVGKSNWRVNAVTYTLGVTAAATIVLQVRYVVRAIEGAPPEDKVRVGLRESLGLYGATKAGRMAWPLAGQACRTAAQAAKAPGVWGLVLPVAACVTAGGAVLVAAGWGGRKLGELAGEAIYAGGRAAYYWVN